MYVYNSDYLHYMYMYTRVCPECIYIVYIDTITKSMSLQNNLKNSYPYKITLKFSWLIKLVLILVIVFTPLVWLLCFTLGCSEPAFPAPQVVRPCLCEDPLYSPISEWEIPPIP